MTTFSHQYLATYFFSEDKIKEVQERTQIEEPVKYNDLNDIETTIKDTFFIGDSSTLTDNGSTEDSQSLNELKERVVKNQETILKSLVDTYYDVEQSIIVEDISGDSWKGKLITISDPSKVHVAAASTIPKIGQKLKDIVSENEAAFGVNAGGWIDTNWNGNGGKPAGLVISNEIVIAGKDDEAYPVIGFDKSNKLVLGYYTLKEAVNLGVRDAVSFAPYLITNGEGTIKKGNGGWGIAPRTAIGQKQTGEVVFVVIDGRQAHSVGATLKEVQELMLEHGCYNAALLDGGSSTIAIVDGVVINKPCSGDKENGRWLPDAFIAYY